MNKQIITFDANEQSLVKTGGVDKYSSNKVSYIEAHFNLGENWSGYDSIRAVWFNWYECISTVLDTEGICIVPHEVLTRTDKVMVNLVGSISEDDVLTDRLTSYPVLALTVDADARVCGSNTQPITPSEYEQFVEAVKADADRAEEAKDEARVYAGNALSSAQNALISETNASASEDNAKASELNAETYKNQAQTYAQNAHNSAISAENAKDEAEDARDTILGMRAEATTLPEGSSATASYNDGVMSFGIPKGDTGATGATGETGATPQLSIGTVTTTTEPSVTITGTAENPVLNFGLVKGDKGDTGEVSLADLSTLLPTDTASGSIASFPDGQSVIPALSVVADIEPIQDLHGYDKPWSGGANINLFDGVLVQGSIDTNNGSNISSTNNVRSKNYTPIEPNTAYYYQKNINNYGFYYYIYDANKALISYVDGSGLGNTFTSPANASYIRFRFNNTGDVATIEATQIMLSKGSTRQSTFSPYSNICPISGRTSVDTIVSPTTSAGDGKTYTTDLNSTVYGGTLDVVSGVLVADRAMVTLNGSEGWSILPADANAFFFTTLSSAYTKSYSKLPIVCDTFEARADSTLASTYPNGTAWFIYRQLHLKVGTDIAPSGLTSQGVSELKAWLANNPITVVLPLASPQTYQLTPTEVQTLLGQNNIWNDCGDTEVTYKADVTKWVEKHLS